MRDYVRRHQPCSKEAILSYLEMHDRGISERTFDRYKHKMGSFGWHLEYVAGKGYVVEEEQQEDIGELFLMMNTIGFLAQQFKDLKEMRQYVRLSKNSFRGQEYLPELLRACKESIGITFNYTKHQDKTSYQVKLDPYLLKENGGQWYVVGAKHTPEKKELRVYGIDRMDSLQLSTKKFKRSKTMNPEEFYAMRMGVGVEFSDKPMEIILETSSEIWNWIESDPWHISQKKLEEHDGKVRFSLFLVPNMALQRSIVAWAPEIAIIEPKEMREHYRESIFKEAVKRYR